MNKDLKNIFIDLTPVLPDGENGGAKHFSIELIKALTQEYPKTHFTLLTQAKSHDELASMDQANISRLMIEGSGNQKSLVTKAASFILNRLPFIPGRISLLGYQVLAKLKKRGLASIIENHRPDLIFCPFTAPTYALPDIPSVCVIHDIQYKTHPGFFAKADFLNRDHAFTEACRLATRLAAISDYSTGTVLDNNKNANGKIRTVHSRMAKRTQQTEPALENLLKTLHLEDKKYLIYPANFWLHKNHEMLLNALEIAYERKFLSKEIKLVFTGSPGQRQEWLVNATEKMGLKSQVIFTGYLKTADLGALLKKSAGLIFPSLYEGFGLPVLEAMSAQVPVACSNTTSLPEIAGDGAILFDPRKPLAIAKAMDTLLNDDAKRQELIAVGNQRVQTFGDSSKMAREYWDLFQEACQSPIYNSASG